MFQTSERSYRSITRRDLKRLATIAQEDLEDYFMRRPDRSRDLQHRLLCIALCQGAALHFVDGKNGVKDFDVWAFFRTGSVKPFPYRRHAVRAFGKPSFGCCIERPEFPGRPVDLFGRSIPSSQNQDPANAVRDWLKTGKTISAKLLRKKAVVLLEPADRCGEIIWRGK